MRKYRSSSLLIGILSMGLGFVSTRAASNSEKTQGQWFLEASGQKASPGFCIVIGCEDPKCLADLSKEGKWLIQGLTTSRDQISKIRESLQAEGGSAEKVSIIHWTGNLPYVDNLANTVICDVSNFNESSSKEILRVLCPNGVGFIGSSKTGLRDELKSKLSVSGITEIEILEQNGTWAKFRKPWPKEMDNWTHWNHDVDGNRVSKDTLAGPPRHIRWMADPAWPHDSHVEDVPMLSSNGRFFYGIVLGSSMVDHSTEKPFLVARDAFNGMFLWQKPVLAYGPKRAGSGVNKFKLLRTVIATPDKVFAVLELEKPLVALNAATGELLKTYSEGGNPKEALFFGDRLVLAGGGPLRAVDVESGKLLWKTELEAEDIISGEGAVFFKSAQDLVRVDLKTGQKMWRVPIEGNFGFYQQGNIFLARGDWVDAFSAKDGKKLWSYEGKKNNGGRRGYHFTTDPIFADGVCWSHREDKSGKAKKEESIIKGTYVGLDPQTGKEVRRISHYAGTSRCYPAAFSDKYVFLPEVHCGNWQTGEFVDTSISRPACEIGGFVANGLYYIFPNPCSCYPQLHGLSALAAQGKSIVEDEKKAKESRFEKGSAQLPTEKTLAEDWPVYRHDASRTGGTKTEVSSELREDWKNSFGTAITAPVVANGKVFVATKETHQVLALDQNTGKVVWRYLGSSVVDTPPTIWDGFCIFGSRDGWVTCLRADNGESLWRFRVAPQEQLMMAYGQIESSWPVYGSILIEDGVAFASAGRISEADDGIQVCALDVREGKLIWEKRFRTRGGGYVIDAIQNTFNKVIPSELEGAAKLPSKEKGFEERVKTYSYGDKALAIGSPAARSREILLNDLLVARGKMFQLKNWEFDQQTGDAKYFGTNGGLVNDGSGHGSAGRGGVSLIESDNWSTWGGFNVRGNLVVSDGEHGFGVRQSYKFDEITKVFKGGKGWNASVAINPLALLVAQNVVFVAGTPRVKDDAWTSFEGATGGELYSISKVDGKILKQGKLPGVPVWDGMAAANGRLYVSTKDGTLICFGK
jgi:outer membrane protein assembly factor BamB